ncbi:MAG TPA: hypothetical protein VKR43_00525 [Bryobacteraceae bacterium]|nr:hypothetical protein [Bryobacteraceae bacterium]
MRLAVITLLVAGAGAFAQRPNPTGWGSVLYPGTGGPPGRGAVNGGFGSVLYPGTGGPPGTQVAGARAGSRAPSRFFAPPPPAHPAHTGTVIVPYPVYYGGYYGYDPSAGYVQSAPGYSADPSNYASPTQAPVVVINQGYRPETANPVIRDYSNADLPDPGPGYAPQRSDPQATIYLIAMTDHNILAAIAYWVDGDTLNYITQEGTQNRISMALVDREFSKKLNDDRGVEFRLPANK